MSTTDQTNISMPPIEPESLALTEEERRSKQIERNQAAIKLLRSWREEGHEQEQREAWEFISRALDEDRLSDRKFYS
ncbi:MAG TPA: hypothetical protein VJ183_14960 [Chloroflexia bacterium]|nr:hypothetical protein [Chloroflexia bacterium]